MTRGPKRKPGKRDASGRLSRSHDETIARHAAVHDQQERETLEVGLSARVRVWGIDPKMSRSQMAGSVVGRLCLTGELSREQYDAAQSWLSDLRNWRQCIAAPRIGAVDLNAIRGGGTEIESEVWYRRCCERMKEARAAIQQAQNALQLRANLWAPLDLMVGEDRSVLHLVGDLRLALNALSHHYGHT